MKASFENSMNVLIRAYMNDTLEHASCCACAVGNLVADARGFKFKYDTDGLLSYENSLPFWADLFRTVYGVQIKLEDCWSKKTFGEGRKQIYATGYTVDEMMRIEFAFETAPQGNNADDYVFNGLIAVCDVLADIHGIDLTVKQEYVKQLETICNS